MANIIHSLYEKVKATMEGWNEPDIYAVSFFVYSNESYEYDGYCNVSSFAVSYNTEADCENAGPYDEERWNYAFWRQDETPIVDPDDTHSLIGPLFDWYKENGIVNIGYEDIDHCYDENGEYIGKGPVGHYELITMVADVAKRLQEESFMQKQFGRRIPIIIHGLEYAWYDMEATKKANPNGQAQEFFEAMKEMGVV